MLEGAGEGLGRRNSAQIASTTLRTQHHHVEVLTLESVQQLLQSRRHGATRATQRRGGFFRAELNYLLGVYEDIFHIGRDDW